MMAPKALRATRIVMVLLCCMYFMTYLDRVRSLSKTPVCAGFGIRSREQVELLRGHVDGVVVGSALVEVLERGGNPTEWLGTLRPRR